MIPAKFAAAAGAFCLFACAATLFRTPEPAPQHSDAARTLAALDKETKLTSAQFWNGDEDSRS